MTAKEVLEPFIDIAALKDTDKFLIQGTNTLNHSQETNTAVRLTAALVKAYLVRGLIDVTEEGYIVVNGVTTSSNINTPQFRRGASGIEVSTDNGSTWTVVALWSEISFRQPIVAQTGSSVTIYPNVLNVWGEVSSLNITLGAGNSGEVCEYMIQFSCGSTPATVTLPSSVQWTEEPTFEANHTYQISILNNLAVCAGWEAASV